MFHKVSGKETLSDLAAPQADRSSHFNGFVKYTTAQSFLQILLRSILAPLSGLDSVLIKDSVEDPNFKLERVLDLVQETMKAVLDNTLDDCNQPSSNMGLSSINHTRGCRVPYNGKV